VILAAAAVAENERQLFFAQTSRHPAVQAEIQRKTQCTSTHYIRDWENHPPMAVWRSDCSVSHDGVFMSFACWNSGSLR